MFNDDFCNMVHIAKFGVGVMVYIASYDRHLRRFKSLYGKGEIGSLLMDRLIHVVASESNPPTVILICYYCTRT